jgi:energy-coupling factor transport system substrate-specific component
VNAKDFINIGLFTALYFLLFFATGMIGYIPLFMLLLPVLCPLVAGIAFMLYLTRVNKFGMVTMMGTLLGLLMMLTGHPWSVLPFAVGLALLADLVLKAGRYRSWTSIRLGYVVFSEWLIGLMFPMFFMRDHFFAATRDGYGTTYADTLMRITPPWVFYLMIALVVIGALAGAYLGRALLKKHFQRAGIA